MRIRGVVLMLLLAACAEEEPSYVLTLASRYDAVAVVRVLPSGVTPMRLEEVYLTFDRVALAGDRVSGSIARRGAAESFEFEGIFGADGELSLAIAGDQAALTSSVTEVVDELGGRGDDLTPRDGVAEEITGYLRTRIGLEVRDGVILAVAKRSGRPEPIDPAKVTIRSVALGMVEVRGEPGAVVGNAGVEILRFRLRETSGELTLGQAETDGSFSVLAAGIGDDVFVLRARVIGRASEARVFRVSP
jgi:hypothetical protein